MAERSSRRGWTQVAFGDVVRKVSDRVDPETSGLERYVAGEHMDTDDLRIRRWGTVGDGYLGPAFHMHFKPGQVLYGSRRTYLRKVAVPDFEGITANTTFVLESKKPNTLLPELLPFIMQTESFHQHSIKQSKGSVNPYVNFSDLAWYEFDLPTLEEQRRIATVIAAECALDEHLYLAAASLRALSASLLEHYLSRKHARMAALGDIATVERGRFSHRPRNLPEFYGGDADFVQTGDVAASTGFLGPASQTLSQLGRQYSRSFPPGTVLITIAAVIGATAVADREIWCPDSVVGICPDRDEVDSRYLELALRSVRSHLENHEATSSTQKNINLGVLRPLRIALLPLAEQEQIVKEFEEVARAGVQLEARRAVLRTMTGAILAGGKTLR